MLDDIETLNRMALQARLDATKISFHAFARLRERYGLLRSGGALGRGCGPLVVSREPLSPGALAGRRIAIPGELTTAALLLRLFEPALEGLRVLPFHEIMPATARGDVDAGVIIHESRFTYPRHGLHEVGRRPRNVVGGDHRPPDSARRHPHPARPRRRHDPRRRPRPPGERRVRARPPR